MTDPAYVVSPSDAAAGIEAGWQVVDVRLDEERVEARIAGSVHIQLADLGSRASEINTDGPVLIYCKVGARSSMAVDALRIAGIDARNLDGGITAWKAAGLPVQTGA